jgi:DNA helicase HerA-like ATPase
MSAGIAADGDVARAGTERIAAGAGADLDIGAWTRPIAGRTPCTIVSVAHLDDEERALVLGVVLEETLTWVRTLPGSARLKALIVVDEVYGFLPPHPASPPTKRPLVALMKQARAYGVGCVVATQNPMDLDYRALSNAAPGSSAAYRRTPTAPA